MWEKKICRDKLWDKNDKRRRTEGGRGGGDVRRDLTGCHCERNPNYGKTHSAK